MLTFTLGIFQVNAQVLDEDFNGPGFPAGWTRINNDGNTPNSSVSWVNDAWVLASVATGDSAAISTSWYTPAGTSDDWLITPQLTIGPNMSLKWQEWAPDASYPDGYLVKISTAGNNMSDFTTTLLTVNAANSSGLTDQILSLSAYNGQQVYIAFINNSNDQYLLAIDNVFVGNVPNEEAELVSLDFQKYIVAGNVNITGALKNNGAAALTSIDLNYQIDGGSTVTDNLTGLNIASGASHNFTHGIAANLTTVGEHDVKFWLSNPNGNADADNSNDTLDTKVYVVSTNSPRKVVIQDHTGAWCQFCPDGSYRLDTIAHNNSWVVPVAVHNGDAMVISEGTTIQNEYISGYPSGIIDFYPFDGDMEVSRTQWSAKAWERKGMVTPVGISIINQTYDTTTKTVTATVKADFHTNFTNADIRFNFYVTEDGVTGTGSGYNQVNFYNTQSGHPYFGAGNPIVGFHHNHTLRAAIGGAWGNGDSIPATINDGDSFTHTFTYTVPTGQDPDSMHIVGVVQNYSADNMDREIFNAVDTVMKKPTVVATNKDVFASSFSVYPNPTTGNVNLNINLADANDLTISVTNVLGATIKTVNMKNVSFATEQIDLSNLQSGLYLMKITSKDGMSTVKKIEVMK